VKVLKGCALSILSFLLFLSLSIFGLVYMLNETLLDPDFVTAELKKLDLSSLAGELVSSLLTTSREAPYLTKAIDETVAEMEPWLKKQLSDAIYASYDYLMGRTPRLNVIIPTQPLKDSLKKNLIKTLLASPPRELAGASPDEIRRYADEAYQQFAQDIPPAIELTEAKLPGEVMTTLKQVRQGMSYVRLGYQVLIGFMALLVLGIALINHQVKGATRSLGTTFLTYGVFEYAGVFAAKYFARRPLPVPELPASLQAWLAEFVVDLLTPLERLSLALLIAGAILLIVSFVYRPHPAQTASAS